MGLCASPALGGRLEGPPVIRRVSLAPAFQRRGARSHGAGRVPSLSSGLGSRPLGFRPSARLPDRRASFPLPWGKAELCGPLGVDRPVRGLWVWEPLCPLQLAACVGRASPWRGAPRNWREGASVGPGDPGCPVSRGQCSGVPGTLQSRQRPEPPVSRGTASTAADLHAQLHLPRGPGSQHGVGPRRTSAR